ncbi:hypothetical protein [Caudoviricetes sp.]|nr:hypothetical protein [Caudoviricetes sp.]
MNHIFPLYINDLHNIALICHQDPNTVARYSNIS